MKINSIKLTNFRQYKNVELEFEYNNEKNVTVIIGDNGFGKTTLVGSFLWCLYKNKSFFKDKILLNRDVADSMSINDEKPVKVVLEIEHDSKIYVITTEEDYKKSDSGDVIISKKAFQDMIVTDEDRTITISQFMFEIERDRILKEELSTFLFYDGENNKIETSMGSKKMKNAVYGFMGIQKIINMNTQFDPKISGTVIRELQNELKSDDDLEMNELKNQLEEYQSKRNNALDTVEKNEDEIEKITKLISEKEKILDVNKDIEHYQKDKRKIENNIQDYKTNISKKYQYALDITNGRTNNMLRQLFAYCYKSKNIDKFLEESSFNSNNSLSHISEEVIDQLINRGFCLCGRKIESKSDVYNHLIEEKNHMEPHDFGKYLKDFCEFEETSYINVKNRTNQSCLEAYDEFLQMVEKYDNSKTRLQELKEKIEGRPDVGKLQSQINNYKIQINGLTSRNDYIINDHLPMIDNDIDKINKKIEKCTKNNVENALINKCIAYAKAIHRRTDTRIKQKKLELKNSLSLNTQEIFNSMYHGDIELMLNDDFQPITLLNGQNIDNSTGIGTVKNFAFVTALMKTLNELKVMGVEDSDEYKEIYPLVIDAPFSNTDSEHIANICKALPKYCNQLIMVVMKKDYDNAYEGLANNINRVYQIKKHSDTYDTIEELDI